MLIVPKNGTTLFTEKCLIIVILEVHQDLSEYHHDKMKRVQRKLDNLRKTMLGKDLFLFDLIKICFLR